ncbi:MAG: hypothetical protein SOU51_06750 [Collinsella sp.]|nr:hypothetical protein [Collinsella sp.]
MAFTQEQLSRTRRVVAVAIAAIAVGLVAFLVLGRVGIQGALSEREASSEATHSVDDIDATFEPMVRALEGRHEEDPTDPAALLELANAYFDWGTYARSHATSDGDRDHAVELFKTAVGHYDTYLASHASKSATVDRAICLFYAGDTQAAIAALEAFVAQDASFAPAWANLGMFRESLDDIDGASDAYRRAIDTAGDDDAYGVRDYAQSRLDALG